MQSTEDMSTSKRDAVRIADYWRIEGDGIRCELCPHRCLIRENQRGICRVRKNADGVLVPENYGVVSAIAPDPIEKKPLFHFYPSQIVLSFGTFGCNFRCKNCQNWEISQRGVEESSFYKRYSPERILEIVRLENHKLVAWTYNEPIIWFEFVKDTSELLKSYGVKIVFVTNGYSEEDPWKEIVSFVDAFNIDVKSMSEDFYRKVTLGRLEVVLRNVEIAKDMGKHVELTYLVIPSMNDSEEEIRRFARWVVDLDPDTPVHFSRFFPHYNLKNFPSTPLSTLYRIYDIAKEEGIRYVYLGNVWDKKYESTYCPYCGSILIEREFYNVKFVDLDISESKCKRCKNSVPVITR